jgi:hypothetical protein
VKVLLDALKSKRCAGKGGAAERRGGSEGKVK